MMCTIRRATGDDVDVAAPLFDAYRQFYSAPSDVRGSRAFLAERLVSNESVVLLAFDGETAVGFAQLYPSFTSVGLARIVILNDLFVAPAARRGGVARALIAAAESHARAVGAVRLALATQHTNTSAQALYTSLGFVRDEAFTHMNLTLR